MVFQRKRNNVCYVIQTDHVRSKWKFIKLIIHKITSNTLEKTMSKCKHREKFNNFSFIFLRAHHKLTLPHQEMSICLSAQFSIIQGIVKILKIFRNAGVVCVKIQITHICMIGASIVPGLSTHIIHSSSIKVMPKPLADSHLNFPWVFTCYHDLFLLTKVGQFRIALDGC